MWGLITITLKRRHYRDWSKLTDSVFTVILSLYVLLAVSMMFIVIRGVLCGGQ